MTKYRANEFQNKINEMNRTGQWDAEVMGAIIEEASRYSKRVAKEWKDYNELTTYYNYTSNTNGYTFEDIYYMACDVMGIEG